MSAYTLGSTGGAYRLHSWIKGKWMEGRKIGLAPAGKRKERKGKEREGKMKGREGGRNLLLSDFLATPVAWHTY